MIATKRLLLASAAVILILCDNALAAPLRVGVRVADEAGNGVAGATVAVQRKVLVANSEGEVVFEIDSPTTVAVRVEAPGYYAFIHTLHRSDFLPDGKTVVPDIRLVKRVPGRTLFMFAGDAMLSRRYFEPRAGEPVLVRRDSVLADGKKLLAPIRPYIRQHGDAAIEHGIDRSFAKVRDVLFTKRACSAAAMGGL